MQLSGVAPNQIAVALSADPARPLQMRQVHGLAALRLALGIEPKDELNDLSPVRASFVGVEKTQILAQMRAVIVRKRGRLGRSVIETRLVIASSSARL